MPTRTLATILLAVALVAASCGDDDEATSTTIPAASEGARTVQPITISTPEYLAFRAQPVACSAEPPEPAAELAYTAPDDLGLSGIVTAIVTTSCGDVVIELDADTAPATVNSFVFLADQGYFDGTVSHRIVPGFVIQAGDPTARGDGGPGYLLPDELPAVGFVYARGTVAMANAGANTGGSQFFIVLSDAPLPPAFTAFGFVTSGLDVLDEIAAVPTTARAAGLEPSSPLETVYIVSVETQR